MRRSAALCCCTLACCGALGCSDDEAPARPKPSHGCKAGELRGTDGCDAAGVAPDACGAGFTPDDARGCVAVLPPEICPRGTMAVPGELECHDVAPCGEGRWGDIP